MRWPENPKDRYFNFEFFDLYYYFDRGDKPMKTLADAILRYYDLRLVALVELVADAPDGVSPFHISYVNRHARKYYDLAYDLISELSSVPADEFNLGDGEERAIINFLKRHKNVLVVRINDGYDVAYAIAKP